MFSTGDEMQTGKKIKICAAICMVVCIERFQQKVIARIYKIGYDSHRRIFPGQYNLYSRSLPRRRIIKLQGSALMSMGSGLFGTGVVWGKERYSDEGLHFGSMCGFRGVGGSGG